jgi:hypothetical protein
MFFYVFNVVERVERRNFSKLNKVLMQFEFRCAAGPLLPKKNFLTCSANGLLKKRMHPPFPPN